MTQQTYRILVLNSISPQEVQAFLLKYQLTQKRAAELTGFGEKNISRWLTGHSRPSESVSNFLRVLLAEDVTGKGHTTRVGPDEDLVMLLVPLAQEP